MEKDKNHSRLPERVVIGDRVSPSIFRKTFEDSLEQAILKESLVNSNSHHSPGDVAAQAKREAEAELKNNPAIGSEPINSPAEAEAAGRINGPASHSIFEGLSSLIAVIEDVALTLRPYDTAGIPIQPLITPDMKIGETDTGHWHVPMTVTRNAAGDSFTTSLGASSSEASHLREFRYGAGCQNEVHPYEDLGVLAAEGCHSLADLLIGFAGLLVGFLRALGVKGDGSAAWNKFYKAMPLFGGRSHAWWFTAFERLTDTAAMIRDGVEIPKSPQEVEVATAKYYKQKLFDLQKRSQGLTFSLAAIGNANAELRKRANTAFAMKRRANPPPIDGRTRKDTRHGKA